jgi:hypothetical protein
MSVLGTIRPLRRGALFVCYQGHFRRSVPGSAPVNRAFDDWCFGDRPIQQKKSSTWRKPIGPKVFKNEG